MELLQCTASLLGGSVQCNSYITLPHCLGAMGSATPATHCLTAWGWWAVELLQRTTLLLEGVAVKLLQCTAALPGGGGLWNSCHAVQHCLGAVGGGTPAMRCLTALRQRAVQLLQYTAPLHGGTGQWSSCNALPYCLGAMGNGTPAVHCLTA